MIEHEGWWVFTKAIRVTILRDVIGYFFYFGTYEKVLEVKERVCLNNIVADGWAGATNPHPHFTHHTYSQKVSKTLASPLFDSCSQTNGPMD